MILIALGHVPEICVATVNTEIARRILQAAGRQALLYPIEGPRLSRRSQAASQGQEPPPVEGVHHKVSQAKQMRERAKNAGRELQSHEERWWDKDHMAGRHVIPSRYNVCVCVFFVWGPALAASQGKGCCTVVMLV